MRSEQSDESLENVGGANVESSKTQDGQRSESYPDQYQEQRKIRKLQLMMNLVMSVIAQDKHLTVDQAAEIVASSRKAALDMFPDKELAYNLIYKPRIQRLMRERFRIQ